MHHSPPPFAARLPRLAVGALALGCALARPVPAGAWGFPAHRLVNGKAIESLPGPLRPLFAGNAAYLRAHAIDPDLWVMAGAKGEGPNHFFDLDSFGAYPFDTVSRDEAEHLRRHGEKAVVEGGRLPWRVAEVYRDLVEAFRERDTARVLERAAVLGHYAADAHVPLHAVTNYDGQLTGQKGVHGRWESALFARFERQIEPLVAPAAARSPGPPVPAIFDVLLASSEAAQSSLAADRETAGARDFVETAEDDRYDDAYYSRLFEREGPRIAARLTAAAETVAGLWLSAWEEAGRPEIDSSFRVPFVRGESRLVVAVLEGAEAGLVGDAVARGVMPELAAARRGAALGRLAGAPSTASLQEELWTSAPGEGTPGRSAEPLWVTAAREGLTATVVGVPLAFPFEPFLKERRFGGNFDRGLVLLAPDPAAAGRSLSNRPTVAVAADAEGGLVASGDHEAYARGRLGPPLWDGGDGTAERRYLESARLSARQHERMAALALDRTRWSLTALRLPFPGEALRLWADRLDPARPGYEPALAARLRPFVDEALGLADSWLGAIARRLPKDAALAVAGDAPGGLVLLRGRGVAEGQALGDVPAADVAPTLAALQGLGPPAQARGHVLGDALSPLPR
jgi:hypothetical protein